MQGQTSKLVLSGDEGVVYAATLRSQYTIELRSRLGSRGRRAGAAPATQEPIGGSPEKPGRPMGTFGGSWKLYIRSLRAPVFSSDC